MVEVKALTSELNGFMPYGPSKNLWRARCLHDV